MQINIPEYGYEQECRWLFQSTDRCTGIWMNIPEYRRMYRGKDRCARV